MSIESTVFLLSLSESTLVQNCLCLTSLPPTPLMCTAHSQVCAHVKDSASVCDETRKHCTQEVKKKKAGVRCDMAARLPPGAYLIESSLTRSAADQVPSRSVDRRQTLDTYLAGALSRACEKTAGMAGAGILCRLALCAWVAYLILVYSLPTL